MAARPDQSCSVWVDFEGNNSASRYVEAMKLTQIPPGHSQDGSLDGVRVRNDGDHSARMRGCMFACCLSHSICERGQFFIDEVDLVRRTHVSLEFAASFFAH